MIFPPVFGKNVVFSPRAAAFFEKRTGQGSDERFFFLRRSGISASFPSDASTAKPAIHTSKPIARLRPEQDAAREENLREFTKNVNDRRLPQRDKEMRRTRKCLILKTSKSRRARKRRRERTKDKHPTNRDTLSRSNRNKRDEDRRSKQIAKRAAFAQGVSCHSAVRADSSP